MEFRERERAFDPDVVYGESQDGNMMRRNLRTLEEGLACQSSP